MQLGSVLLEKHGHPAVNSRMYKYVQLYLLRLPLERVCDEVFIFCFYPRMLIDIFIHLVFLFCPN